MLYGFTRPKVVQVLRKKMTKCMWLEISRVQRETEKARGEEPSGVRGYTQMGCYSCDGKKLDCPSYDFVEKGLNI